MSENEINKTLLKLKRKLIKNGASRYTLDLVEMIIGLFFVVYEENKEEE